MTEKTVTLQENDSAIIFRASDQANFKLDLVSPNNGFSSSTISSLIANLLMTNDYGFRQLIKARFEAAVRKAKKRLKNDKLSIHSK
jgi:hypothetical protein